MKENLEVFAWTPYEMPGIDPKFICHELNVHEGAKLVIRKPRRSAIIQVKAVNEEVDWLLEVGAIQEVHYLT